MHTLAIAGSRERLTLTAVEHIKKQGDPWRMRRVVTFSGRMPEGATPDEQHTAVLAMSEQIKEVNGGSEPLVVVAYGGAGSALFFLLREDYDKRRRVHRAHGIAISQTAIDVAGVYHKAPTWLASNLYREWHEKRLEFAPGLKALEAQVTRFRPVESKGGNIQFGPEDLTDYDDAVVSLMYASAYPKGEGAPRFIDRKGKLWPSFLAAKAQLGQGAVG